MDSRLYDVLAALAANQPAAATEKFGAVLKDRVDQHVADFTSNYKYEAAAPTSATTEAPMDVTAIPAAVETALAGGARA